MEKFSRLLDFFPEVDLPVLLTEEQKYIFEEMNDPLPGALILDVLTQWEDNIDEYTEFVPCFRLPKQENFQGLVYWKGSLLKYEFILATFNNEWKLISKRAVASTIVDGHKIRRSVASIDPDLIISILAGQEEGNMKFDPGDSAVFSMEILPSGEIIFDSDHKSLQLN